MRKIIKKIVLYQCKKCKTTFSNAKGAKRCEAGGIEPQAFKVGDRVRTHEHRFCRWKYYTCIGTITKISGPIPFDGDRMKWIVHLFPTPIPGHLWEYTVSYICPGCKKEKIRPFLGADLKPDRRK